MTNEIITYADFKKAENKEIFAIKYPENHFTHLNVIGKKNFNVSDLLSYIPTPSKMRLTCEKTDITKHVKLYNYKIVPLNNDWNTVDSTLKPKSLFMTELSVFTVSKTISTDKMLHEAPIGLNNDIHLFFTLEDCQNYITECHKKVIKSMLEYCNDKILQYTTIGEKLLAFFEENFKEK